MAAIKESAEEDKEVESFTYDTQDLTSTSSYNNNSLDPPEPLPLDSHQNPLNGVQSNPFVCGSVPAAPSTNDSLPSRALVNGAASHCTSEEPCVHNKDMSPLPGTDTSPEVLPPPSELQSDTRQKTEGCVLKEWLTRASSESNNGDGEAPLDVPVEEGLDNRPISRLLARKQIKAGCLWDFDSELSESSSDDCDGLNWGLQEKFMQLLLKSSVAGGGVRNKIAGAPPANQRRRMRKTHTMENATTGGQIYDGFDYASQNSLTDEDSDFDSSINKEHAFRKEPESLKAYAGLRLEKFCDKAAAMKELISSENEERCDEGRSEIDTNTYMGEKLSPFKAETKQGKELSFFPCSKCNANFKEKIHLHRHMMYHLDGNNKVKQEFVPRPFICRECGRSFRGLNSLQKHMVIHQVQRERLMEEIKSLGKIDVERRRACIQCVFGTKCPQTFGSTNEREGNSCEDHMTRTEMEHQCTSIHNKYDKSTDLIICQMCTFKCYSKDAFRKHMVLIHGQQYYEFHEPHSNMDHIRTASDIIADQPKTADSTLLFSKPKIPSTQMWSVTDEGELALRTNGSADLNVRSKETQKACDGFCSSLIKWSPGSQANKLSPFSRRSDTPSKLSPLPTEKIDVTTGLPYVEEDNQEYESTVAEKRTKYLSSFDVNLTTKTEIISKPSCLISNTESCPNDPSSNSTLAPQTLKHKIPSKRKMSIPYRNIHVNIPHVRFPNCEPESSRWESHQLQEDEDDDYDVAQDNSNCTKESLDQFYNNTPSDYFISGQASPFDSNVPDDVNQSNLDHNIDSDEICTLIIKEECIESIIGEDSPDPVYGQSDPYADYAVPTLSLVGRKCCPYCPAVFESGVGLSNHVRGHMHRVGLSYEARHMVSPEQVASQDRQPRIRRKVHPVNRRIRKDEIEPKTEHTCPLCLGWFDTKTGLSNHVRGHLKRIGKPISGASKSPLSILTELLQDETEYKNIIRVLGARPHISKHFVSQKFASSDGLFLTSTGIPVKIQHGAGTERQWDQIRPSRENTEKGSFEKIQSSNLEHLLENRKVEKMEALCKLEEADTHWSIFTSGSIPKTPSVKLDPTWSQEKFGVNKKICIHCNATFHSGVSLSNHLRAYARRKRIALLEGTTYDCKQKRSRSRSGPKRKVFSSSHPATEVIYRMTCRFCDLIFQGPQSVQEDWIKHLQRHLMHTSIPGMGTGMVEVSAMCKELCSQTPPERLLLDTQPPLSLSEGIS